MPKVIQVIKNEDLRGKGVKEDPYRRVVQYLDFDGNVLAEETDPYAAKTETPLIKSELEKVVQEGLL